VAAGAKERELAGAGPYDETKALMNVDNTRRLGLLLLVSSIALAVAAACGDTGDGGATFATPDASVPIGEAGPTPPFYDGSPLGDAAKHTLTIQPADSTVDVTAPGATTPFTALLDGSPTTDVAWNLDSALTGTIDKGGVFTANAQAAGVVTIFAETPSKTSHM